MSRYSRKAPGKGLTVQFSMIQIWLQTALMSETLCVITMTPPLNSLRAVTSASTVSRSRWLVGSSSSSRCVRLRPSSTKTTRDFWPPDSVWMSCSWCCPSRPKRPRALRTSWYLISGKVCIRKDTGVSFSPLARRTSLASWSQECWLYTPTLHMRDWRTSPLTGSRSCSMSLSRVDLPVPLAPTSATRESMLSPKSTSEKSSGPILPGVSDPSSPTIGLPL
mmetsp:Transcript_27665/g.65357  ORF Transcript_27665/g.65357 Transcript_27665/m.65357 type:complete len:221 (+) Transcript_27665:611-1273(+)